MESTLKQLVEYLKGTGFTALACVPALRRSVLALPLEPLVAAAFLRRRTSLFTPTTLSPLYLSMASHGSRDLRTLFRLFHLNEVVGSADYKRAVPAQLGVLLVEKGIVAERGDGLRSTVRFIPFRDLLILCDPDEGADRRTVRYVYAGGDSVVLADFVERRLGAERFRRGLDLCAGTAFQALSCAGRCDELLAAEYNPRAVEFAGLNVSLNGCDGRITVVQSDLWENVEGRFDLIVSNPPYYPMSPEQRIETVLDVFGGDLYGMEKPLEIVRGFGEHLEENGYAAVLAASPVVAGRSLLEEHLLPAAQSVGLEITLHAWEYTSIKLDHDYQRREGIDYLIHYVIEARKTGRASIRTVPLPFPVRSVQILKARLALALSR